MERINNSASYDVCASWKWPASLNETANLQNSSDSLNPQSFKKPEECHAEPSSAKSSMDRLFKRGEAGIWLLNSLIREGKLNLEQFNAQDAKNFAMNLLKGGNPGVLLLARLMNDNKLPKLELPEDNVVRVVNALYICGMEGLGLIADLINKGKLPNFPTIDNSCDSKRIASNLLSLGPSGLGAVKALVEKNKLDPAKFDAQDAKNFALKLLESGAESDVLLLARLMNDNKLPKLELPEDDVVRVVDVLYRCGMEGLGHIADLINKGKLPNFPTIVDSYVSKRIACDLLSRGPSGLAVLKALVEKSKLDPAKFNAQDAKEFANAMLGCGVDGRAYLADLINKGKLPKLESQDEVEPEASQFEELHSTFEHGITKAFFGETSNVDGKPWEAIWKAIWLQLRKLTLRLRLWDLPLKGACEIWRTIANEVAAGCFSTNGKIDIDKLKELMAFLGNEEIFKTKPYCLIPHAELMRSQMYTVCERLLKNKNQALDLLNAANEITVGQHGRAILDTMSNGKELTPAVAILSSLFTPHRQRALPTCTIDSFINAEIRNHPKRLIKIYKQMLEGEQFTLPSGYAIPQQEIVGGFITVDLKNGGHRKDTVFEDITSYNPYKIRRRKKIWKLDGIKYIESSNQADKYKLSFSVHNMNDILFAHFFQASEFGNIDIDGCGNSGIMFLYAGLKAYSEIYSPEINVGVSNFLDGMTKLKRHTEAQRQLGHHYMRVMTTARKLTIFGEGNYSYHAENIDIDALLALDLNNMKIGKAYPISDRNWSGSNTSGDIPRLAIRKMGDIPPTYEFGTLWDGSQFEKINLKSFSIYDNHTYYIFNKGHNHWN